MRGFLTAAFICIMAGSASAGGSADQAKRADELDRLFGQLHARDLKMDASKIESQIRALWDRNDSATAEALLQQGTAAMNAHEYEAAEQTLIQLVESYPDFAEGWNRRATLYFMQGRFQDSLTDIGHVLELEPRHFGALGGKAMILQSQGKIFDALRVLHETLAIDPHMDSVAKAIKDIEKKNPDI